MSTSHTTNHKPGFTINFQHLKSFAVKNLVAVQKYWPLMLISQLPCVYMVLSNYTYTEKVAANSKVEAKNLDLINKKYLEQKELEKRLKSLNERFLVLQTQHAKMVKAIIAVQEKSQNVTESSVDVKQAHKKEDVSVLEIFEKIGQHIKLGESYSNLMASIPTDLKNHPAYETLGLYANKVPPTFNDLIKAFAEIQKNYSPVQQLQDVPKWLQKIAELFKGELKIAKGNSSHHSPIDAIKEALELRDFQLAADAAQYIDNTSIKKWAKLVTDRINLEQHYQLLAEQVSNITLAKKDSN